MHSEKAFFSIMQNKTDKGTLHVSKSLPIENTNSVNRLFSARNMNDYVSLHGWSKENGNREPNRHFSGIGCTFGWK